MTYRWISGMPPQWALKSDVIERSGVNGAVIHDDAIRGGVSTMTAKAAFSTANLRYQFIQTLNAQVGLVVYVTDNESTVWGPVLVQGAQCQLRKTLCDSNNQNFQLIVTYTFKAMVS
jgi:hypothetical protein